jgi:hypothetical protein
MEPTVQATVVIPTRESARGFGKFLRIGGFEGAATLKSNFHEGINGALNGSDAFKAIRQGSAGTNQFDHELNRTVMRVRTRVLFEANRTGNGGFQPRVEVQPV